MTSLSGGRGTDRATIRDVAALAGVGTKTVSRVINGEPNVAPATQERVRKAAAALRYVPDLAAGNLRRTDKRTGMIGVLVGDVMDPFFAEVNRAVEDVASARDLALFTASSHEDHAIEQRAIDAFLQRRVDGLLLACASPDQRRLADEQDRGLPMVFFDRPPVGLQADAVVVANAVATARAVTHLARHGHRRVAGLFDRAALWTAQQRAEGFLLGALKSGISPADALVLMNIESEEASFRATLALLSSAQPPTALVTGRSVITVGAIRALRHLGRHREVALIGYDDLATADLLDPGLTVIAQRVSHLGRLAVEQLLARIDGRKGAPELIEVDADLIERGSGELPGPGLVAGRRS